ncbi:unnamed protein product, partial [Timema podura]|nr:unnamed protein product [Timema podura]
MSCHGNVYPPNTLAPMAKQSEETYSDYFFPEFHVLLPFRAVRKSTPKRETLGNTLSPCQTLGNTRSQCQKLGNTLSPCQTLGKTRSQCQKLGNTRSPCQTLGNTLSTCQTLVNTLSPRQTLGNTLSPCQTLGNTLSPRQTLGNTISSCLTLGNTRSPCHTVCYTRSPCHTPMSQLCKSRYMSRPMLQEVPYQQRRSLSPMDEPPSFDRSRPQRRSLTPMEGTPRTGRSRSVSPFDTRVCHGLSSKVALFNKQVNEHLENQAVNPFSGEGRVSPRPKLDKHDANYGKPVGKTALRGMKAQSQVSKEILELCVIISENGEPLA